MQFVRNQEESYEYFELKVNNNNAYVKYTSVFKLKLETNIKQHQLWF